MSDTQDSISLRQRQMQQRQILAMMGVAQWVQPDSPTLDMVDIAAVVTAQPVEQQPVEQQPVANVVIEHDGLDSQKPVRDMETVVNNDSRHANQDMTDQEHGVDTNVANEKQPVTYQFDSMTSSALATADSQGIMPAVESLLEQTSLKAMTASQITVSPFDLQGGRYGNWVLIVDIQALNNDSQKLWQNIIQALSLKCETSSFPICAGMDTAELANASLAGYIFKIGRSEDISVAALTVLPDGVTHPNFNSVPSLEAMLTDSALKRQLWAQISH